MSTCIGDSASDGAAVFAAPLCARDIVQRQRRGVNDPGIALRLPPRRGPRGRSRPAVVVGLVARLTATMPPRIGAPCERNRQRVVQVDYPVDLMVVLRCTQKLLAQLKRADVPVGAESTTRLGEWYGKILRIGHRQHLLFISERSRFRLSFRSAKRAAGGPGLR